VNARDELAFRRSVGADETPPDHYEAIHMPKNTMIPVLIGVLAFGFGFGMVWRIWWMAGLSLLGIIALVIFRSFVHDHGYLLSGEDIARMEGKASQMSIMSETQDEMAMAEGVH
jgi:cytochrome o ubiquinol oxidase subunit 1